MGYGQGAFGQDTYGSNGPAPLSLFSSGVSSTLVALSVPSNLALSVHLLMERGRIRLRVEDGTTSRVTGVGQ